jgi:hypothetical protein
VRGERGLLRIGEYLIGRACRRLPRETRADRYQEWAAELPAILHDPEIRLAPHRAVRMLSYAADTVRGAALSPSRARRRPARPPALLSGLLIMAGLMGVVWNIWDTVREPGHWLSYVLLAWSLLVVASSASQYLRPAARMSALILTGSALTGVAVSSWNAAQAPADLANYLAAGVLLSLLLAWWLVSRWARAADLRR